MRRAWPVLLFLIAATGAVSCSRTADASCGAIPRDFCAPFRELSDSLSEQERAAVLSLTTTPARLAPAFNGLLDRTQAILRFGRDDAALAYLHQSRVDDIRRAHQAILCGYAWWLKSGSVSMESLLRDGDGACWWVPRPVDPPREVWALPIIDAPPPPLSVTPLPLAPSPPVRLMPLGSEAESRL